MITDHLTFKQEKITDVIDERCLELCESLYPGAVYMGVYYDNIYIGHVRNTINDAHILERLVEIHLEKIERRNDMNILEQYRLVRSKYVPLHRLSDSLVDQGLKCVSDNYGTQIAYIFDKAYNLSQMRAEVLELRRKINLRRKKCA